MASQKLLCSCGHGWERPNPGPVPADIREICPICTPGIREANCPTLGAAEQAGAELKPGDRLASFEIIRALNRGGMGVVYKARQRDLDRFVALKVVAPERLSGADNAEYLERFRREARASALLNHPNIVTVYATDLSGPCPYFAMEFVEGIDLYRLVERNGPLGFLECCEYIRQAALGLQHAFERGLVHRDIKPHNLMVTPSPLDDTAESGQRTPSVVKILDMGLARLEAADKGLEQGLTMAESFLGTPDYAAPEQAEDSRLADNRADLYSLGATWFYLLTAQVPFPGVSLMQKLRRQLTQPTPVVTQHRPDAPPVITAIIRRLMDRDPAQRFQSAGELAQTIADFVRDPSWTPDWMPPSESEEPLAIQAHAGSLVALAVNGNGKLLLSGGDDETLRVWELPGLAEVRVVSGDPGLVSALALTGSGKTAASCALRLLARDMVVQLWDLGAGVERKRLRGALDSLVSVALSRDGRQVVAGSRDGTIYVWTLDPVGTPMLTLRGHSANVTGVAFTPDGSGVQSGALDGLLLKWDLNAGKVTKILRGEAGAVRAIASDRATGCLAVAGDRVLLRHEDGRILTLAGHPGGNLCVAFSADGELLASGGHDSAVRVWRTSNGEELACFEGHAGPVRAVGISADRRFAYSGGGDGTLRRWPIRTAAAARSVR